MDPNTTQMAPATLMALKLALKAGVIVSAVAGVSCWWWRLTPKWRLRSALLALVGFLLLATTLEGAR